MNKISVFFTILLLPHATTRPMELLHVNNLLLGGGVTASLFSAASWYKARVYEKKAKEQQNNQREKLEMEKKEKMRIKNTAIVAHIQSWINENQKTRGEETTILYPQIIKNYSNPLLNHLTYSVLFNEIEQTSSDKPTVDTYLRSMVQRAIKSSIEQMIEQEYFKGDRRKYIYPKEKSRNQYTGECYYTDTFTDNGKNLPISYEHLDKAVLYAFDIDNRPITGVKCLYRDRLEKHIEEAMTLLNPAQPTQKINDNQALVRSYRIGAIGFGITSASLFSLYVYTRYLQKR
ncbi:MAG: hypothetical protein WCE21_05460 [Candidatus Babeliales bacterium]